MNRIDRLTAMILMLQSQRVVTAEQMAEHFALSVRTIYRDIAALGEAGVPIAAEAGIGYSLMRGFHMPPIMFTEEEAVGLFMSGELTEQFGDDSLKKAVRSAMLKVRAVLPLERKNYLARLGNSISVSPYDRPAKESDAQEGALMTVQKAVVERRCLTLCYNTGGKGEVTSRTVEPLGVIYYGNHWHLVAWCRLREGMRDFRLDRVNHWETLREIFGGHEDFSLMEFIHAEMERCELTPVNLECDASVLDRLLAQIPARVVEQKPLPNGRVRIDALAYRLEWLSGWLLGFGTTAIAKAPPALCRRIGADARELAALYERSVSAEGS